MVQQGAYGWGGGTGVQESGEGVCVGMGVYDFGVQGDVYGWGMAVGGRVYAQGMAAGGMCCVGCREFI